MVKLIVFITAFMLSAVAASAQWVMQQSGTEVRLRGVSAVSSTVAWASGDKGTFVRTTDGGKSWQAGVVPGAEALDFRDVDAFDADTAYLLSIGEGDKSRIYKTTDGGKTWTLQFKSSRPQAFFDSMAFWDRDHGVAVSDPVQGRFLVIKTSDGGKTWTEMPASGMPQALAGEGAFAASGTCITVEGKRNVWFGTGGPEGARIFRSRDGGRTWNVSKTPMISGKSAGIFSVTFWNAKEGVAVGGDYTKEQEAKNNFIITKDGGKTWKLSRAPDGYRSCIVFVRSGMKVTLFTVGPSGSEYSNDEGRSWVSISVEGFHSVSFKELNSGWAVGEKGRIGTYVAHSLFSH